MATIARERARCMTALKLTLVVACALIDVDKRVLLAQRPDDKSMAGLWEFPGGKVEPGERPEATLIRELHEELGITVKPDCLAPFTFASHGYQQFHLLMPLYLCRRWEGTPEPREHSAIKWVRPHELIANSQAFPMPPADLPLSAGLSVEVEVDTGHERHLFGADTPPTSPGKSRSAARP